jgi:hypothetical protein
MSTTLIHVVTVDDDFATLDDFFKHNNVNVEQVTSLMIHSTIKPDGIEKCINLEWLALHFSKIPIKQYHLSNNIKIVDLDTAKRVVEPEPRPSMFDMVFGCFMPSKRAET